MNQCPRQEIAVIGAGIVGLSTAYSLASRGAAVRVYEQSAPGTSQSGGHARLFRHNHVDPRLIEMAIRSRVLWDEWSEQFGVELVSPDGSVMLGPKANKILPLLRHYDVPARTLDSADLAEILSVHTHVEGPAVIDERAGAIHAKSAIDALATYLKSSLVIDEVLAITPTPHGTVEVRSSGGCHEFASVVVCAGRNTTRLAQQAGVTIPLTFYLQLRGTFRLRNAAPPRLACLQDSSSMFTPGGAYGAPLPDRAAYAVGISHEPDEALMSIMDRTKDYVARALPGLDPEPIELRHCWVTKLPWSDDGFSVWEAENNVYYLAGHNLFKHAPVIGDALARAALGQGLDNELRPAAQLGASLETTAEPATQKLFHVRS